MGKNVSLVLLVIFLFFSGCAASKLSAKNEESLKKAAAFYYNMLMWKYYDRASAFIDQDKRAKYERFVLESQDTLNITRYEIRELIFDGEDKDKSLIRVLITYYKYPSVSEKSVFIEDVWILKNGKWYVQSDFEGEMYE